MKTIILFAALALGACNAVDSRSNNQANKSTSPTPAPAATQYADGVRRVTIAELDQLMKQGKVVVVDVRSKQAYDLGHIPGAKLIPVGEVGQRFKELPRDKTIVTYCS